MAKQPWIIAGFAALATLALSSTPATAGSFETKSHHLASNVRHGGGSSFHFSFGASQSSKHHGFKQGRRGFHDKLHGFRHHRGFRKHRAFHRFRAKHFGHRGFRHHGFKDHRFKHHRFRHERFPRRGFGAGRWTRPSHW